mmetsp:Transcript_100501/g.260045  ORF Transcript_100501/g.260045 Transcript_100501/m.260045 type:complete len:243 (+) Transcript_100501:1771-2499(+)
MILDSRLLVVSLDALVSRLEVLVLHDTSLLHDHIITNLGAQIAPLLHALARDLDLVLHEVVIRDRQDLPALWTPVASHWQAAHGEMVFHHRRVHKQQCLHGLLLVQHGHIEALPEAPLAVELPAQRGVSGDLPRPHNEEHVEAGLWIIQRILVPLSPRVGAFPEDHNLFAMFAWRRESPDCPAAKLHLPQASGVAAAVGGEGKVPQPPLGWQGGAALDERYPRASVCVALLVDDFRGVHHKL